MAWHVLVRPAVAHYACPFPAPPASALVSCRVAWQPPAACMRLIVFEDLCHVVCGLVRGLIVALLSLCCLNSLRGCSAVCKSCYCPTVQPICLQSPFPSHFQLTQSSTQLQPGSALTHSRKTAAHHKSHTMASATRQAVQVNSYLLNCIYAVGCMSQWSCHWCQSVHNSVHPTPHATAALTTTSHWARSLSHHTTHNFLCLPHHQVTNHHHPSFCLVCATTQAATASSSVSRSALLRPAAAFGARRSRCVVVRAAADNSTVPAAANQLPTLEWPQDTETARDVFAFAGSLPEVRGLWRVMLQLQWCDNAARVSEARPLLAPWIHATDRQHAEAAVAHLAAPLVVQQHWCCASPTHTPA